MNSLLDETFRPVVVCLCGSTKFREQFERANADETLAGKVVLSVGSFYLDPARTLTAREKAALDELHVQKIAMADEVLVINVGGYVGASTKREVWYAYRSAKKVRWLEPNAAPDQAASLAWFASWSDWQRAAVEAAT